MRSNNPLLDAAQDISGNTNPSLDVEAPPPTITPLTGITKLKQKPPKYSDIFKGNGKNGSCGSVSSTNTGSLSSPPEYSSKVIFHSPFKPYQLKLFIIHIFIKSTVLFLFSLDAQCRNELESGTAIKGQKSVTSKYRCRSNKNGCTKGENNETSKEKP